MHTVILGAPDPEMDMIWKLCLDTRGEFVPSVAYHNGNLLTEETCREVTSVSFLGYRDVYAIECDGPAIPAEATRIDPHRKSDPFYASPPSMYWEASSLGRVAKLVGAVPTDELRIVAAWDYSPLQAYHSCPGVDRELLLRWRVGMISPQKNAHEYTNTLLTIRSDVRFLESSKSILVGTARVAVGIYSNFPTLEEASYYRGIPYVVSSFAGGNHYAKYLHVLRCADASTMERWASYMQHRFGASEARMNYREHTARCFTMEDVRWKE